MAANQDKADLREAWYKLVVKVISWREGLLEGGTTKPANKITKKEWAFYCKEITKVSLSSNEGKGLQDLKELKKVIASHGGFE